MTAGDRRSADSALIAGLAAGLTIEDAAKAAHIGESTAYRRLKDEAFRQQVREVRAEVLARSVGRLSAATVAAVETLQQLLRAEGDQVKLGAARAILDQVIRLREHTDLEERIAELEARTATLGRRSA
jgi:hypothetical protein